MQLRSYQREALAWALPLIGEKPIAMALPTSWGKSLGIKSLADRLPGRTAIITYSNALVGQFIREFPTTAMVGKQHYRTEEAFANTFQQATQQKQVIFNPASYVLYMKREDAVKFDNLVLDEADACLSLFRILNPTTVPWEVGAATSVPAIVDALEAANYADKAEKFATFQHRYWWEVKETVDKKNRRKASLLIHDISLTRTFSERFFPKNLVGMSGTMFPSFCSELFGTDDYHYYEAPSPIDISRRRITAFTGEEEISYPTNYEDLSSTLKAVLDRYHERPAIVHVSYADVPELMRINEVLKGYQDKGDKQISLELIEGTDEVLLAAGAVEGLNLVGERARLNVLLRASFPSRCADSVQKHMALPGGEQWYKEATLRAAVQAAGRTTRGPTDYSVTVIADKRLVRLICNNKHLLPKYFLDACDFL